MSLRAIFVLFGMAISGAVAAPLAAQNTQPAPADATQKSKPALDPNETVCEAQREPGSRLSMVKVCHTRAEWADLRNQDRQELDRVQTRRAMDH